MREKILASVMVLMGAMSGCGDSGGQSEDGPQDTSCQTTEDCFFGEVCVEAQCVSMADCGVETCACEVNADCDAGLLCEEGSCVTEESVCEQMEGDELAAPEAPRLMEVGDCPSGQFEEGICQPLPPASPEEIQLTDPEGCPGEVSEDGICLPMISGEGLWVCPEGWDRIEADVEEGSPAHCLPPELPEDCEEGTMPLVGQAECVRIGIECPAEGALWHDEVAIEARAEGFEGGVLYVAIDADEGGDGSRELPFATLTQAIEAAEEGDVVALSMGVFTDAVVLPTGVALVGACPEGTRVVAPELDEEGVTLQMGQDTLVSDLSISGERRGIEANAPITQARVQSVWIERAMRQGVNVTGARGLVLSDLLIEESQPTPSTMTRGQGIFINADSEVAIERVTMARNHTGGLTVVGGNIELVVHDAALLDTQPSQADGRFGRGLDFYEGVEATIERVVVARNHSYGILVSNQSGTEDEVRLRDIWVKETRTRESDNNNGKGLQIERGAKVDVARVVLTLNKTFGLVVTDDAEVEMRDAFIDRTLTVEGTPGSGGGIAVHNASLSAERVVLSRNDAIGIIALQNAEVSLTDFRSVHTQSDGEEGLQGRGLLAQSGSRVTIKRAELAHNHELGLFASGNGTRVGMEDVWIHDTQPQEADMAGGKGIEVLSGASLNAKRVALTDNIGTSLSLFQASADIEDLLVRDTLPGVADVNLGHGMTLDSSQVTFRRTLLHRNHGYAVRVRGGGTRAQLNDTTITETLPLLNPRLRTGFGILVERGGGLIMTRALLSRNTDAGVSVDSNGSLTMIDTTISETLPRNLAAGVGLVAGPTSDVVLERVLLVRNHVVGITVEGGSLEMTDTEVYSTLPGLADQRLGRGVSVGQAGQLTMTRSRLASNHDVGFHISGNNSSAVLDGVTIVDTRAALVGATFSRSLNVQEGARVTVTGTLIGDGEGLGAFVSGPGAHLSLTDSLIIDHDDRSGLGAENGGLLDATRVQVLSNTAVGISILGEGTVANLEDVTVSDTQLKGFTTGRGLNIQDGARVNAQRLHLIRNLSVALFISGAEAIISDLRIEETGASLNDAGVEVGGTGLIVVEEGHASLTRFSISGSDLVGVGVGRGGTLEAVGGEVKDNFIGFNSQDESFDFSGSLVCVDIAENCCGGSCEEQLCNVESRDITVPNASDATGALSQ